MLPSDRIRTNLALEDYRAAIRPKPTVSGRSFIVGYNAVSGKVQTSLANGAIAEAQPALISDLGLGDIGYSSAGVFV